MRLREFEPRRYLLARVERVGEADGRAEVEAEPVQPETEAKPMNTCKKEAMYSNDEDLEDSQIPLSFDETFASDMHTYAFGNLQTVFAQTV